MARVKKSITVCDRDGFGTEREATEKRSWTIEGVHYEIDLCAEHAAAFDRDQSAWTMLAREVDRPREHSDYFVSERRRERVRIDDARDKVRHEAAGRAFAARRAEEIAAAERGEPPGPPPHTEYQQAVEGAVGVEELQLRRTIPGAMGWHLSHTAEKRMRERGYTIADVLHTVTHPEHVESQAERGAGIAVYQRGPCRIVVNELTYAVITVKEKNGDRLTNERAQMAVPTERKAL